MVQYVHSSLARGSQADQAPQRGGLAGAVAAQKRDDFALPHFEADVVQDVALAVVGMQAFRLEYRTCHAAFPR